MKFYYITFRSVTYAQRAEQLLRQAGIRCDLQRTPRWMEEKGCGYSLRLRAGEVGAALELLRRNGVALRKVYVQQAEGILEEAIL